MSEAGGSRPRSGDSPLAPHARLIVDGFNALGSRPDGWWRDRPAAMVRLVARLEILAAADGPALTVVFDGREHAKAVAAGERVEVVFAGPGRNAADRVIAALVRDDPEPGAVLVVSSDRRLQAAVKAAGGVSIGSGEFVREILPGDSGEAPQ